MKEHAGESAVLKLDADCSGRFAVVGRLNTLHSQTGDVSDKTKVKGTIPIPRRVILNGDLVHQSWQSTIETFRDRNIVLEWQISSELNFFQSLFRIVKADFSPRGNAISFWLVLEPAGPLIMTERVQS